jgi:enamine deaminase RidA (YjgF/YER057c/UK114 family)
MLQRVLDHVSFREHHLTAVAPEDQRPEEAARPLFDALAAAMRDGCIEPLQQKIFGPGSCRAEVLAARARALAGVGLDPDTPCAYVSGRLDEAEPLGVQVWGVTAHLRQGVRVTTVGAEGGPRGRLLEAPSLRLLWLAGIDGALANGEGFRGQAKGMFQRAERALALQGFDYRDVVRTWIYLRRLLDDYAELNEARTAFHGHHDLVGGTGASAFPASTGIQGTSAGEGCLMDLVALSGPRRRPLARSSRQPEAFDYGSGFSRGMALDHEGARTVFVSGTASVGGDGRTRHAGDAEGQVLETLLGLAAVLEPEGASLRDVASGTLFAKDRAALEAYRRVTQLLALPPLPLVPVLADVCRPELLLEIDAVALLGGATPQAEERTP